jgi:signal transduction histidine kinase
MLQLEGRGKDIPLDQARQSIARAIEELRTFSFALMPQDLGGRRFSAAVRQFAMMVNRRAGLEVTIDLSPQADRLSAPLQQALMRIIQEALTNVLRHAEALKVTVKLTMEGPDLLLVIEDAGIDRPRRPSDWFEDNAGVGMAAMRSRLVPFDGQLIIEGTSAGTRVRVFVPRLDLDAADRSSAA